MKELHVLNLLQIALYGGIGFLVAFGVYPRFIDFITRYKLTKKIRDEDVTGQKAEIFKKFHQHKSGTPTMGGAVIIGAVLLVVVISRILAYFGIVEHSLLNRGETYLPIVTLAIVGGLGLVDDYLNITERSKQKGLSAKVKFWTLFAFAVAASLWFTLKLGWSSIHLPGIGDFEIGLWYMPVFVLVLIGSSHAVNITDGLDGLAGGLSAIAFGVFAVVSYFFGLPILATFCAIITAVLVAFLWFNVPPAKIYMGDTGSLALGATMGVIAMMTNALVIFVIVGIIFIVEIFSSALQIFWKKKFKKKLFLIAPIHHHFEAKGWSETQIVMRFWIIGLVTGIIGLLVGVLGMGNGVF